PLLDGDALRSGDGPGANWRCKVCDGTGQPVDEIGVISVKGQKRQHRSQKIFDVLGLGMFTAASGGFLLLCEPFRGALGSEVGTNAFNGRRRCPNAPGENLPPLLL